MTRHYIGVIQENGADCTITFPDFPDCTIQAGSPGEAVILGRQALESRVAEIVLRGEDCPEPASTRALMKAYPTGMFTIISVRPA